MKKIEFVLTSKHNNKRFVADARWVSDHTKKPTVILVHGFKGFKDWGAFNVIADQFANLGYCCVKLNFSSDGTTIDHPFEVTDLDAFGNNNFSKELDDLGVLIDWLHSNECPIGTIDLSKLYLLGHSRGGGVVLLKTAEDSRIKKVATLASIPQVNTFSEETVEQWKKEGVIHVVNGRTGEELPLYFQAVEDYYAHEDRLSMMKVLPTVKQPILHIHGDADETVPVQAMHFLHQLNPNSECKIIEGASHTFGTKHPWTDNTLSKDMQTAIDYVLDHFSK
ncbi:hypothetical protein EI427_13095 [Flammeovirga pectinis]|uniref:Peptidase S9 prolyl oligopeptidase catalytic domain-containing protein n=1 Tax=Flammeovirga pectinis TaxID=2494373 RepID=A0A3S9P4M3_9BACT|nr:alpha/beta fold hydrolase [Flammeovirga pectinis]AZQ63141.1 hypothetical protein EI427_13095 [Flammeovirga pectinis]